MRRVHPPSVTSGGRRRGLIAALAALLLLTALPGHGRTLAVISDSATIYYSFLSSMARQQLIEGGLNVRTAEQQRRHATIRQVDALVVVGVQAAMAVAPLERVDAAVLYAMIPRHAYRWLARNGLLLDTPRHEVLYLDQPPARYHALARAVLPSDAVVGVLYSEATQADAEALQALPPPEVVVERVPAGELLLPYLDRLLRRSDALLMLPDPALYDSRATKALLRRGLRLGVPVLGYSVALARAGALAVLYSTPADLGRHAGERLSCLLSKCDTIEAPQWPRYFSARINPTVARRLGIEAPGQDRLLQRIKGISD